MASRGRAGRPGVGCELGWRAPHGGPFTLGVTDRLYDCDVGVTDISQKGAHCAPRQGKHLAAWSSMVGFTLSRQHYMVQLALKKLPLA